ncbi:hypothetical protein [Corallococcus carmarthensis]|uniref:Uncharacterized protein n=1 Tax=Corallococcus carmarthensis TaxID=2316728 RepID=A0A3A8K3H6_9BACT|nr:hypothetical protein [Corallococcus carmarthensis]NOK19137.1 hypothetical protein [Corallococcus carmarthensis]RKG98650.1 hypothetical protein D7X32_28960 [Corallococcus carmarthensis]
MDQTQDIPPAPDLDPARAKAAQDLSVPAILMMVMGGLWVLYALYGMLSSTGTESLRTAIETALEQYPPDLREKVRGMLAFLLTPAFRILSALPGVLLNAVVVSGGWRMKNLQSYGLAMTAAIICCIPCCGPLWGLGLIPGIWSLVVLNRPEVKAAFRSK